MGTEVPGETVCDERGSETVATLAVTEEKIINVRAI